MPSEIGNLTKLQILFCGGNVLTFLPSEIRLLTELQVFKCSRNVLTFLPSEIGSLFNLQSFDCSDNALTELPSEIGSLNNLQYLYCSNNNLKSLPSEIGSLNNLQHICYSGNEIEYIPPQVLRIINRQKKAQKVYGDGQNVHNHHIQEGIVKSINYITSIKPAIKITNLKDKIINLQLSMLTIQTLFEYIDDNSVHSVINITFEELLISVLDFILKNQHKEELLKILDVEMQDSLCKCFTGRMSRLINVLNGYDEHIVINISDTEQIGNILIMLKEKYGDRAEFESQANKELLERGYSIEIIMEWLNNI